MRILLGFSQAGGLRKRPENVLGCTIESVGHDEIHVITGARTDVAPEFGMTVFVNAANARAAGAVTTWCDAAPSPPPPWAPGPSPPQPWAPGPSPPPQPPYRGGDLSEILHFSAHFVANQEHSIRV